MDTQDITEEMLREEIITYLDSLVYERITEDTITSLKKGYTDTPELTLENHVIRNLITVVSLPLDFKYREIIIDISNYWNMIEEKIRQTDAFQSLVVNSEQ